jgi:hypothetical protein
MDSNMFLASVENFEMCGVRDPEKKGEFLIPQTFIS